MAVKENIHHTPAAIPGTNGVMPDGSTVGEGRRRVIIERVSPEIDAGRFAIKRVIGEEVTVEADIFSDGHDELSAALIYRKEGEEQWQETPMQFVVNDRWRASFVVAEQGRYVYSVYGWVDHFKTWSHDMEKRVAAGQNVAVDLEIGAQMVDEAAAAADEFGAGDDAHWLRESAVILRGGGDAAITRAEAPELEMAMLRFQPRRYRTYYERELLITVDRERARFSSWYELFPRSTSPEPGRHGTFKDVEARLPYVADMGFNVLYFPPIHPIGRTFRKGKNNNVRAEPGEPGSPWAIGSEEGGHKAVHPELGTLQDFRDLVWRAGEFGLEIALDIAFQCAPDHPWVREHPEWFRHRPDGTIQYAENPPKKYQDIYPINFESSDWQNLWLELKSVFDFWIEQGVKIFRVDNPHTKAFRFWDWCINAIKREHPDVIFLSEAFTRPKVMYQLAKLGFTQSYTYFTWRTEKWELIQYLEELTQAEPREYFGFNFWPNTPDILTPQFYDGHRSTFLARLAMAATMAASYGIYGPAYELMEYTPVQGKEEYIDNEKYEIKTWDLGRPDSLRDYISRINRIRNENPALHKNNSLRFHRLDNDMLIAYSKHTPDLSNLILTVVNLDPDWTQSGWVQLPLDELGLDPTQPYQVEDLISDNSYIWSGEWNYVELNPDIMPVHIFVIRRRRRNAAGEEFFA